MDNSFGHDYRPGEPLYAIVNRDQKQRRVPSSNDNYSPNENIHFWNGDEFGNYLAVNAVLHVPIFISMFLSVNSFHSEILEYFFYEFLFILSVNGHYTGNFKYFFVVKLYCVYIEHVTKSF